MLSVMKPTYHGILVSLTVRRSSDLASRIELPRLARILVQHGVASDSPDLATWAKRAVRKSDSTCSLRSVRNFLGY